MELNKYPYFDNNATTPVDKRVLDVLNEFNQKYFANPSSTSHPSGMICNSLYNQFKTKIAGILNEQENDIIFTSGSTESINTAIKGVFFQYASQKNHIISCPTEHSAVLQTLKYLEEHHHAKITLLNVDENGNIDLNELEKNICNKTLLICLMAANNETGVLHPLDEIYRITQKKKVLFFSDTTQLFGKQKMEKINADIYCGSAHKFYGCKGIGFLVVRNLNRKFFLHPLLHGGNQQDMRSGTLPLPLIAALSVAMEKTMQNLNERIKYTTEIRNYFEYQIKQKIDVKIYSESSVRLVNTSNIQVDEYLYDAFIKLMKKFCFSHASACSDGSGKPSHVLKAMGLSDIEIKHSFRFSFSHVNTKEEVDKFIRELLVYIFR